jgi:hypothetical protein
MVVPPVRRPGTLRQRPRREPRETKGTTAAAIAAIFDKQAARTGAAVICIQRRVDLATRTERIEFGGG